ncbi:MAG: divalent-cation tolerance protein CutA [Nanoarchaeota archaeon]|nr:divalent-cation tolerance protein CutA [Nanoarchaeota archaeon]
MPLTLVYIPCPSEDNAREITRHLLEKKIIACANLFPIRSMFWWEGKIVDDYEHVIVAKTTSYALVKKEVEKIHEYEKPCILKISAEANKKYMDWVKTQIKLK